MGKLKDDKNNCVNGEEKQQRKGNANWEDDNGGLMDGGCV